MARVEDEWGVGLERVWEQVTARLLEENKGNKMKRDLCQMHFGKMKEALFSSLEESLDMKTGEPKGTSKPSPTTGLEEELKEAQEQYQLAKEQLINHQTHTPEEVAAHFLGHAQGPKHLCNVEPLPYFDEEKRGGGGGREGGGGHFGQVRKLEGECELVEKRMRELKGELGGLEGRSKQISEFVADSGVACSVLDKLVAEDDEEEEEEGEEEGKRKRKRKEEETPRTSARRKVAVGLGQK